MKILSSFQRITSHGNYVPEIDGLRFLAIVPVVLMHANTNYNREFPDDLHLEIGALDRLLGHGGVGVWIFFAISGFVLSNTFVKHFAIQDKPLAQFDLRAYFLRRLTRLEPPFIISTLILFIFSSIIIVGNFYDLLPNLIASLVYCHQFVFGEWSPINPVTWSLEVEVQFYLIAPFLCYVIFKTSKKFSVILLFLLFIGSPLIFLSDSSIFVRNSHLSKSLPVYFHHFLVGIIMATFYNSPYWTKVKGKSFVWDIVCIFCVFVIFSLDLSTTSIVKQYILGICILLVMISSFKANLFNRFFSNRVITIIGGMCYSIYLLHYAVLFGVMKVCSALAWDFSIGNYILNMSAALFATLACSIIFYKFFERPFMGKNWLSKFFTDISNFVQASRLRAK